MMRIFACGKDKKLEKVTDLREATSLLGEKEVWVDCESPSAEEVQQIAKAFGLHPLSVEDSLNERQRPKIDEYPQYYYLVLRVLDSGAVLSSSQVNVFLGEDFLITIHKRPVSSITEVQEMLSSQPTILGRGVDFLCHQLLDAIVDDLFPVLDRFEERVSLVEDRILKANFAAMNDGKLLNEIFKLRKELLQIRKVVFPQRENLHSLITRKPPYLHEEAMPYYRDIYDHLIRMSDLIETYRELLSSAMEAYLSVISNNLNAVMKKLTAITILIMVPALIAGIYGMNFQYIPELNSSLGFFEAIILMVLSATVLAAYLRWKKWI